MAGRAAVASGCVLGQFAQPAPGCFGRICFGALAILGRQLLNICVHLPLILPPVVTGYVLLLVFGQTAPVGRFLNDTFGIALAFRWTGAVLAASVMAFPLKVRAIHLAIEAVDPKLE